MDEDRGKCHICKETRGITYCNVCGHWFCGDCRNRWWPRGIEAVLELVKGKTAGCCGPEGAVDTSRT